MKMLRLASLSLITVLVLALTAGTSWADRGDHGNRRHKEIRKTKKEYVIDKRHRHNRSYPRHGHVVKRIPHRHREVVHRSARYYFSGGVWYRPSGAYFTVVAPPVGVVIPILPRAYTTVWYGGDPYYYAAGTYYRWYPERRGYIVTEPPENVEVYEDPEVPDELYVYPRAGQDRETLALDRFECHRWASAETGFDPTRPGGGVEADENAEKRSDYNRATKACLEARDYSVQ